ncbi:MAG: class I SAM-dependent methyltransferase [Aulosira sp. ZfuVER01]|nr:methyltransferase domain-containing protein [Aulosira sp. ZfuVER01]MDZ7997750.1 methyltransferase domain-containing protein [Aulosira sp. DedVER01a]MDZ8052245.1 methyltransferase domain-containing protein [Aulosira sp. ZfuCHP01]
MVEAINLYTSGEYGLRHRDWHLDDATYKVRDIMPALKAAIASINSDVLRIADVGAGVGGVVVETVKQLTQNYQNLAVDAVGFEISPYAVKAGRELFPNLDLHQKFFESSDGPFDVVLFIDVLEHLENPWEMLRIARDNSRYIIVRQPLLDNFSTFRHNNYSNQRETWGHIGYFNYYSFMDMTKATGWQPIKVDLVASWELAENQGQAISPIHSFFTKTNRIMASHFLSGFYLNGLFQRY